jgi:hypothetical protein
MMFITPPAPPNSLRQRLRAAYRADETACVEAVLKEAELPAEMLDRIALRAR